MLYFYTRHLVICILCTVLDANVPVTAYFVSGPQFFVLCIWFSVFDTIMYQYLVDFGECGGGNHLPMTPLCLNEPPP